MDALGGDPLQHLHTAVGVTRQSAQGAGGLNAGHTAGVGDADAPHVFDDVAAAQRQDTLGVTPQHLTTAGGGIGQGNGLGAAHGGHQLLRQYGQKILFYLLVHFRSSLYKES